MTGNPLELFRKFFGAVRAIFWRWGSFLAPEKKTLFTPLRRPDQNWFAFSDLFLRRFPEGIPSRTLWRGLCWNCPSPSSVLRPPFYRAVHFFRVREGRTGAERRRGRGWPAKEAKSAKGRVKTGQFPVLPFLFFCWKKRRGKPPKKQGFLIPTEPLKSLEKMGKTLEKNKEFPSQGEKNKELQRKNKERKDRVFQQTWEGFVRERGGAQICHKLCAKFAQNCWYFVSCITRRVRKILANP